MRLKKQFKKYFIIAPVAVFAVIALLLSGFVMWQRQYMASQTKDVRFGVTFSVKYAEELGLDWKEVYDALLDDMGVRYFRIPVYWSEIEPISGEYDWEKFDYIIERAEDVGAEVIIVVGRRQPRWPECHVPLWAYGNSETVQRVNILSSIDATVKHFRLSPAVIAWQVDNEPLLKMFGECPEPDTKLIRDEVELVRSIDSTRPIMMTESGELSTWLRLTALSDWIGVSMYRVTWNDIMGYWTYPLTPNFYRKKAKLIGPVTDKVIISELQAEPWVKSDIKTETIQEQYYSMNPEIFRKNIRFATETGIGDVLLWGAEWWYWLKEVKGDSDMWDTAYELFSQK